MSVQTFIQPKKDFFCIRGCVALVSSCARVHIACNSQSYRIRQFNCFPWDEVNPFLGITKTIRDQERFSHDPFLMTLILTATVLTAHCSFEIKCDLCLRLRPLCNASHFTFQWCHIQNLIKDETKIKNPNHCDTWLFCIDRKIGICSGAGRASCRIYIFRNMQISKYLTSSGNTKPWRIIEKMEKL